MPAVPAGMNPHHSPCMRMTPLHLLTPKPSRRLNPLAKLLGEAWPAVLASLRSQEPFAPLEPFGLTQSLSFGLVFGLYILAFISIVQGQQLQVKNQSLGIYSLIYIHIYLYLPSPSLCVCVLGPNSVIYLTFALKHTPLHPSSRLGGLEGCLLKFWAGFDHQRVAGTFVLQVFFKGKLVALDSPFLQPLSTLLTLCF